MKNVIVTSFIFNVAFDFFLYKLQAVFVLLFNYEIFFTCQLIKGKTVGRNDLISNPLSADNIDFFIFVILSVNS